MGFCILNNAMTAARYAQFQHSVLGACLGVVDAGAGTQAAAPAADAAIPGDVNVAAMSDSDSTKGSGDAMPASSSPVREPLSAAALAAAPLLAQGLRVAIVDIDTHVGNGTQGQLLAIAQQLGLAEHVWSYDPAAPPARAARSKRVLSLHHRSQRRILELPAAAGSATVNGMGRTAMGSRTTWVVQPAAASTLAGSGEGESLQDELAAASETMSPAASPLEEPMVGVVPAFLGVLRGVASRTDDAHETSVVASSAVPVLPLPSSLASYDGTAPEHVVPARHLALSASGSLGHSAAAVTTLSREDAAPEPGYPALHASAVSSAVATPHLDARGGLPLRSQSHARPRRMQPPAPHPASALAPHAQGGRVSERGLAVAGHKRKFAGPAAVIPPPVDTGSSDSDDCRSSGTEGSTTDGSSGGPPPAQGSRLAADGRRQAWRFVAAAAPGLGGGGLGSERERRTPNPRLPPRCWRSNRAYYRVSPVAGAHAHDLGRRAHGWLPLGLSASAGLSGPPSAAPSCLSLEVVQVGEARPKEEALIVTEASAVASPGAGTESATSPAQASIDIMCNAESPRTWPQKLDSPRVDPTSSLPASRPVGLPAVDVSRAIEFAVLSQQRQHASKASSAAPPPVVAQQLLLVSIHQYHPASYPCYEVTHDGLSTGDAAARVFTQHGWKPTDAGWVRDPEGIGLPVAAIPKASSGLGKEARLLFDPTSGRPLREWEPLYWTQACGQPRFPLSALRPPSRELHWLADISLPVDVSWADELGNEISLDDLTSDEDSGSGEDGNGSVDWAAGISSLRRSVGNQQPAPATTLPTPTDNATAELRCGQPARAKSRANPGSRLWRGEVTSTLLPTLALFAPDVVIISAGFDGACSGGCAFACVLRMRGRLPPAAHTEDPVGLLHLRESDFSWVAERIGNICPRVVSVLEGGYGVDGALAACAAAHVRGLARVSRRATRHATRLRNAESQLRSAELQPCWLLPRDAEDFSDSEQAASLPGKAAIPTPATPRHRDVSNSTQSGGILKNLVDTIYDGIVQQALKGAIAEASAASRG